jgi:hypothetical protein
MGRTEVHGRSESHSPDWKPDDFVDGAQLPYRGAINRAVERVVTGEVPAEDAMIAAQTEAEAGLRQAAGTL